MPNLKNIIKDAVSSTDIDYYFPGHAKIIQYRDLRTYTNIEQLLPRKPDFFFLLYEDSPASGQWVVLVTRDVYNTINYFDSYGCPPDHPLTWYSTADRIKLKANVCYLSHLLNATPAPVYYNDVEYQKNGVNVATTCGRQARLFLCYEYVKI